VLLAGHVQHSIVILVATDGDRDRLELVGDDTEGRLLTPFFTLYGIASL
jgi:hypothetical protein